MKCHECGGNYYQLFDRFDYVDPFVGAISVQSIPYYKCDKNGDILFTPELAKALDTARNIQMQDLLHKYPIIAFISAATTADLLGITRQALHKNKRIRHGFILSTDFDGAIVYLKQSVLQYRDTGDGRFPLYMGGHEPLSRYFEKTILLQM
jgi:hypothetical protein